MKKLLLITSIFLSVILTLNLASAQILPEQPVVPSLSYKLTIKNDRIVSENFFQFEIWITCGEVPINLRTFQGGIFISKQFVNVCNQINCAKVFRIDGAVNTSAFQYQPNPLNVVDKDLAIINMAVNIGVKCATPIVVLAPLESVMVGQYMIYRPSASDGTSWGCVPNKLAFYSNPTGGLKLSTTLTQWTPACLSYNIPNSVGTYMSELAPDCH
jgi:hypothetical protein